MKYSSQHRGYIFLLSVLVVGTISLAVTASVLLLSTSAARTGLSLKHSSEALALAQACAEHALLQLRSDSSYGGNELLDQWIRGMGHARFLPLGGQETRTAQSARRGYGGIRRGAWKFLSHDCSPV